MKVNRLQVSQIIGKKMLDSGQSKKYVTELAAYLLDAGLTDELLPILRDVQDYWAKNGYIEVDVVRSFPLNKTVQQDIHKLVRKIYPNSKKIVINEQNNPENIGGILIKLPNMQLDVSVRSKLNKLRQLTT